MGLKADVFEKQLSQFSMGEVTRIRLAELIFKGCNLLILDEPTNHLDLASREQLEAILVEYGGAVLLVSHDRYMLEKLCERYLVFVEVEGEGGRGGGCGDGGRGGGYNGGSLTRVDGSLKEWLAAKDVKGMKAAKDAKDGAMDAAKPGEIAAEADPEGLMQSLMAIENRIAYLLGQLSRYKPTDHEYQNIDKELNELMAARKRYSK